MQLAVTVDALAKLLPPLLADLQKTTTISDASLAAFIDTAQKPPIQQLLFGAPLAAKDACIFHVALGVAKTCVTESCESPSDREAIVDQVLAGASAICPNDLNVARTELTSAIRATYGAARELASSRSVPQLTSNVLEALSTLVFTIRPDRGTPDQLLARHSAIIFDGLRLALSSVVTNELPTTREIQLLLIRLAEHQWVSATPTAVECGLDVAFAAMAACHGRDAGCDARAIADFVTSPEEHFDLKDCSAFTASAPWKGMSDFVARGIDIVAPPPGATTRDQLRAALTLVFDITESLATVRGNAHTLAILNHLEVLSLGLANEDTRSVVVEAVALTRVILDTPGGSKGHAKLLKTLDHFTPLVTTLTTNAKSLEVASKNPEQAEALRKARKESLEALIDSSTDRSGRGGDVVASVGANVGFYSGWDTDGDRMTTLGLPMGLAIQQLPSAKDQDAFDVCPQFLLPDHFQISFVDLGQFLTNEAASDLSWNDFLLIGAQVGWIPNFLESPSDIFVLGADVRYVPGGTRKGEVFLGFVASYYVPFFDLN